MSGEAARTLNGRGVLSPVQALARTKDDLDLQDLIARARVGNLPLTRPLRDNEPKKLNDVHLNMIYMRAAGIPQKRIAEILDYQDPQVSIVLNHPFSRIILNRMQALAATQAVDINAKLDALAPHAVEAIEDVITDRTANAKTRKDTAFELLRMTGYGKKEEKTVRHEFVVPAQHAGLLSESIRESREIEDAVVVDVGGPGSDPLGSSDLAPDDGERPPLDDFQAPTIHSFGEDDDEDE